MMNFKDRDEMIKTLEVADRDDLKKKIDGKASGKNSFFQRRQSLQRPKRLQRPQWRLKSSIDNTCSLVIILFILIFLVSVKCIICQKKQCG
jgi:hypothetical protein